MKRLLIVLCLLVSGFSSPGQDWHTVSRTVYEEGRGNPLANVNVYTPDKTAGTTTDPNGFFTLTLPGSDSLTLVFSSVGYQTVTKNVSFRSPQQLVVFLPVGQTLRELTVRSSASPPIISRIPQMSQLSISGRQIEKIPALLGEKDVFRVLQLLPGVQKGSEGTTGIYVRGGGPDQNLILLDDAVIYNSGHLLGFFSAFNGIIIKNVELTKGGFPARYGGRLSSVIEVTTKEGNAEKLAGEASLGLVASRLLLEGPLGKKQSAKHPATFLVAGRRTYIDFVSRPFAASSQSESPRNNTYFYDLNARLNYTLNRKNNLFLSGYWGRDAFFNRQRKRQSRYVGPAVFAPVPLRDSGSVPEIRRRILSGKPPASVRISKHPASIYPRSRGDNGRCGPGHAPAFHRCAGIGSIRRRYLETGFPLEPECRFSTQPFSAAPDGLSWRKVGRATRNARAAIWPTGSVFSARTPAVGGVPDR